MGVYCYNIYIYTKRFGRYGDIYYNNNTWIENYRIKTYMLTTVAGGPVLPLIDTVNVIGCPAAVVSAVIGGGGGTTDSTIEQRDNLLRLFLACFRFNWIFISSRSASKSFFISAEILLFNN
jgi:hypothetical protein